MQISRRGALLGASAVAVVAGVPIAAAAQDALLERLADDYYAAHKARNAAEDAREDAGVKAAEADRTATLVIDDELLFGGFHLSSVFEGTGTLTPSREQVSQFSSSFPSEADKLTEAVMRHLAEYGGRCTTAFEAQGWPVKQAELERTEEWMDELFDRMVETPAQGLRGIAAKVKGLVYPHEWEHLRKGEEHDDGQIDTVMLVSLIADIRRLAGEA